MAWTLCAWSALPDGTLLCSHTTPALLSSKTLTAEYKAKAREADTRNGTNNLESRLSSLKAVVDNLVSRLDAEDIELSGEIGCGTGGLYVLNCLSNIWHLSDQHDKATTTGRTVCRWNYSSHNSTIVDVEPFSTPDFSYCNRCLPRLAMDAGQRDRKVAVSTSSSTSSDS